MHYIILLIFISKNLQKISFNIEQQVIFAADQMAFWIKTVSFEYDQ